MSRFPLRRLLVAGISAIGLICTAGRAAAPPSVKIDSGQISGRRLDKDVTAYLGIPYAAPPIGALRWRPPQAVTPWSEIRAATAFAPDCMQLPQAHPPGPGFVNSTSENCLYLNVWTPWRRGHKLLPVMVWIHGGAWIMGAGSWPTYNGRSFARQGVILVNFNYRLARFGFFSHPALSRAQREEPLSNYGLMDQIAALAWVKRNIAAFGGDAENVTIFGESAGGRAVNILLTSPLARGLFQKAISESGGGQDYLASRRDAEATGQRWAASKGIVGNDATVLRALRALPASAVLDLKHFFAVPLPAPIVDGKLVAEQVDAAFIEGRQAKVPYLTGANSYEQSLLHWLPADLGKKLQALGPYKNQAITMYEAQGRYTKAAAEMTLYGEATRLAPARFYAGLMAKDGEPTWLYRYAYIARRARGTVPGAAHGAEVGLVFDNLTAPSAFEDSTADAPMARLIQGYWVHFARTGNPNGPHAPYWPPYSQRSDVLMAFGNDGAKALSHYHQPRLDLFDKAFLMWSMPSQGTRQPTVPQQ